MDRIKESITNKNQKLNKDFVVYVTDTMHIVGRFFLKQDAEKKARRYKKTNQGFRPVTVDYIGDMTVEQWKVWHIMKEDKNGTS